MHTCQRKSCLLVFLVLMFPGATVAPVIAQDLSNPTNVRVSATGLVTWDPVTGISEYRLEVCRIGVGCYEISESGNSHQIGDFHPDDPYRITIRSRSGGVDSSGTVVRWSPAASVEPNPLDDGRVAPHAGSSINVWQEGGSWVAQDYLRGEKLVIGSACEAGDAEGLLQSSDELEIRCLTTGQYQVVQRIPQHPQDMRTDLLVFDAASTDCYRAYHYPATEVTEIYSLGC